MVFFEIFLFIVAGSSAMFIVAWYLDRKDPEYLEIRAKESEKHRSDDG